MYKIIWTIPEKRMSGVVSVKGAPTRRDLEAVRKRQAGRFNCSESDVRVQYHLERSKEAAYAIR